MTTNTTAETRGQDFEEMELDAKALYEQLLKWHDLQSDIIVAAQHLQMNDFGLFAQSPDGNGEQFVITPDENMLGQMAQKFMGPVTYLRHMQKQAPQLVAKTFNDWFQVEAESDKARNFLLRLYMRPQDHDGLDGTPTFYSGRAFLSSRFQAIDNLPVFEAVLEAVRDASQKHGIEIVPVKQSLAPGDMFLRFICPGIEMKSHVMREYRNPVTGERGSGIASGFIICNSEIGNRQLGIAPRFYIGACKNGMVFKEEGKFFRHLGADLDEGVVQWSEATQIANTRLVVSQVRDAVERFVHPDFLGKKIAEIEAAAAIKLESPVRVTTNICKELGFSAKQTEDTLTWLMNQGSAKSAWDVNQALTFSAQSLKADERWKVESFATTILRESKIRTYDRELEAVTV